jgi:hypothetical protein
VKRFRLFIMALVMLLVVPVSMVALAPASAEAAINSVVWLDTTYKGNDPLLGYVQAYEAGSTVTLKIFIQNTTEDTMTIKGAKVKFDWTGGEYAAAAGGYPATLANNESGIATITFTVPATSVASNLVRHGYVVSVDCEKEGGYRFGAQVTGQRLGTGDGLRTDFYLGQTYVDSATLKVYLNDVLTTDYTLHQRESWYDFTQILFNTAPADGWSIVVDYQSTAEVAYGDGTETEFYLGNAPIVPGTEKIYVMNILSTSYTLDYDTGRIKFTSPPADGNYIVANYQYLTRWAEGGSDFAVYSSEQNSAMAAKQQLQAMGTPGVNTAGSRELLAQSAMEEQLGDQQYAAGNMDEAKSHYEQALTYQQDALTGDKDPNTFKALEPTGTLLLGIGMVLLALGVIVYALKRPKGPSSV